VDEDSELIDPAPLWPHGPSALLHTIRRAAQRSTSSWAASVTTGLSSVQYATLVVLAEMQTCDQQTLGSRAGFDKATGTYLIDRLVDSGLVETQIDPNDRRRKLIAITTKGRRALDSTITQARQAEATLADGLSQSDIDQLIDILSRMAGVRRRPDVVGDPSSTG
jgi:MarR family transcriptional regulator, lower aerobic nicotinate degradation pathway regulator